MSFLPEERAGHWTPINSAAKIPPRFTIKRILPKGIVFLSGPPKTMKTTVSLALALTVSGQKHQVLPDDLQQLEGEPGRVMILNAEHEPGELRQMMEDGFGIELPDDDSLLAAEDPWAWRLDDPHGVKQLLEWLDTEKPSLFILDPLRDFHNLDEKDSGHMNRVLRPVQRWAKHNDSTLLVVHHTRKPEGKDADRNLSATDLRGTSAMYGLADGTITLTPKGRAGVHFSVVLKRGEPWEQTIKLGTWGEKASERIDAKTLAVFDALASNPETSYDELCKTLSVSKSTVTDAVKTLVKLKALDENRKPTVTGRSIVSAAVTKWGATTGLT